MLLTLFISHDNFLFEKITQHEILGPKICSISCRPQIYNISCGYLDSDVSPKTFNKSDNDIFQSYLIQMALSIWWV